jgi:hypothetical protein
MAFILCPGVAEVVLKQTLRSEQVINVVHFASHSGGAPWTGAQLLTLANEVKTNWGNALGIKGVTSTELTLVDVVATSLETDAGPQATSTVAPVTGTGTGGAIANNMALTATLRTASIGRSYRGRIYIGGINASNGGADINHVSGTFAGLTAAAVTYTFGHTITLGTFCVLSRYHDKAPRAQGASNDVLTVTVNTRLDTQRRRMPKN